MEAKVCKKTTTQVIFWCPGCEHIHAVLVEGPHAWNWNNSLSAPTFKPSILVNGNKKYHNPQQPRCHSFVTDGSIKFLNDCTHKLAGQTVKLVSTPEIEQ